MSHGAGGCRWKGSKENNLIEFGKGMTTGIYLDVRTAQHRYEGQMKGGTTQHSTYTHAHNSTAQHNTAQQAQHTHTQPTTQLAYCTGQMSTVGQMSTQMP